MKEALSNLIDNAVKYSGDEVEITFSSGKFSNEYYIKVHDTGFGIPLKDQSKIFENTNVLRLRIEVDMEVLPVSV